MSFQISKRAHIKETRKFRKRKDAKKLTVTSFTPQLLAPRQSPVDIAPQPAYKSRSVLSLLDFSTSVLSQQFVVPATSASLEMVEPDSQVAAVLSEDQEL